MGWGPCQEGSRKWGWLRSSRKGCGFRVLFCWFWCPSLPARLSLSSRNSAYLPSTVSVPIPGFRKSAGSLLPLGGLGQLLWSCEPSLLNNSFRLRLALPAFQSLLATAAQLTVKSQVSRTAP